MLSKAQYLTSEAANTLLESYEAAQDEATRHARLYHRLANEVEMPAFRKELLRREAEELRGLAEWRVREIELRRYMRRGASGRHWKLTYNVRLDSSGRPLQVFKVRASTWMRAAILAAYLGLARPGDRLFLRVGGLWIVARYRSSFSCELLRYHWDGRQEDIALPTVAPRKMTVTIEEVFQVEGVLFQLDEEGGLWAINQWNRCEAGYLRRGVINVPADPLERVDVFITDADIQKAQHELAQTPVTE